MSTKQTFGRWIKKTDGTYRWQISDMHNVLEEKTVSEMNLSRSVTVDVLFLKEYPSRESFDEIERVWFKMPVTFTVRSDQSANIQLKISEGKVYIVSIDPELRMCMPVAFESNDNLIVKKGKAVMVTSEEATEIAKTSKYIFSKLAPDGSFMVTV